MTSKKRKRLGECLVESGLIDEKTLAEALETQKTQKRKIGQILIEMGVADEQEIAKALSRQLNIPVVRLTGKVISKEIIDLVPSELAENYVLIPVTRQQKGLVVAMSNPLEFYALDDLRFVTGMPIGIAVAAETDILDAIARHYPKEDLQRDLDADPGIDQGIEIIQRKETEDQDIENVQDLLAVTERPPVVRLANTLIADAINLKASDIHIEPRKDAVVIRYRVDGIMQEIMKTDKHVHASLVSRIKVISNMDVTIRRKPQDGKAQAKHREKIFDLRVSTIPTSYGEKVTMRILDPDSAAMKIEEIGIPGEALSRFQEAIAMPQGIILVTGPTGSGKSTTLYACLNKLNSPEVNIITVEDPVEYDIAGINQVGINPKAGITFASGLRSILRQDPDIVMVGEIRDPETAEIAFQAAQTGHLVFSTLHTNDAPSAVARLVDLGIDPFLIAGSLTCVIGQRLVRRICPECKIQDSLSPQMMERLPLLISVNGEAAFFKGAGCESCHYKGYSGRFGIYEFLHMTPALRNKTGPGVSAASLREAAEREGYRSMSMDGMEKAQQGLTTIEEIFRVAPPETWDVIRESSQEPAASDRDGQESSASANILPSLSAARPKRILVVDDNEMILKILRNILEAEGFLVEVAKDGLEALKIAVKEIPDLLITDMIMPRMDGIELIKKLKSQLNTRYIPIIMLTAKDEVDLEVKGMDAGADDYLTKPVIPRRLVARIQRLLDRSEQ